MWQRTGKIHRRWLLCGIEQKYQLVDDAHGKWHVVKINRQQAVSRGTDLENDNKFTRKTVAFCEMAISDTTIRSSS